MNRKKFSTSFIVLQNDQNGMLHCRGTMSPEEFCILCPKEMGPIDHLKVLVRLPGPGLWVQAWGQVSERLDGDYTTRLKGKLVESARPDVGKLAAWTFQARQAA